ncbi:MAG: HAD family phosphatase [Bacteroidales bacterium]|nr:HAD family phosphatase [Bacteroidales bacterium]
MIDLKNIKNIIFDLGGVILDIDENRTKQAFIQLFAENTEIVWNYFRDSQINIALEKGIIDPDDFRSQLIKKSGKNVSFQDFDRAWNAILIDFKNERLEIIKNIKIQYNTFLLSNTNQIHYNIFTSWLENNYNTTWNDLFTIAWFSHTLHEKKPDLEIYKKVLVLGHLKPEETLFIDDLEENLAAAAKLGIKTVKATKDYGIIEMFGGDFL